MATPFPYVAGAILTADQLNNIQNLPINDVTANYVLVNNDRYKRVIMNAAGATTITVNNSIFVAGDVIQISNKGAGATVITAGAGVTINTASSLSLAQYGGGYILALSASTFTFFSGGGLVYGTATGLTGSLPTPPTGYSGLYATADSTLTVTKAGVFEVLMFAGAGGGSNGASFYPGAGGGGGAGGKVSATVYLAATTYSVIVGAGGAGGTSNNEFGTPGRPTGINGILAAIGGGSGLGNEGSRFSATLSAGGCGGGGGVGAATGGSALLSQGFAGGTSSSTFNFLAAGGGGTTAVGTANTSGGVTGQGGAGFDVSTFIGGSSLTKGTGGNGGSGTAAGAPGAANTANGGVGGGLGDYDGGAGGSGIFYIRFKV